MIRFEWDEHKNRANLRKHGIGFETAQLVFDDPSNVSFIERITDGEGVGRPSALWEESP